MVAEVIALIEQGRANSADSDVSGRTEICLLIGQGDTGLPVFDSTAIHVAAAVDFALN